MYAVIVDSGEDTPDVIGPFLNREAAETYRRRLIARFGWLPDDRSVYVAPMEGADPEVLEQSL